jgi:hypothetical protein
LQNKSVRYERKNNKMNKILTVLALCLLIFDFNSIYMMINPTKEKAFLSNVEFDWIYFTKETWGFLLFVLLGFMGAIFTFFKKNGDFIY